MKRLRVICPYCHRDAALVRGTAIYPHRREFATRWFWRCVACDAYVGCHPRGRGDGTLPLGRLANAQLRSARQRAHAAFDPLWRSGALRRVDAYAWLADAIGVSASNCHIGLMDVDACRAVVAAVGARMDRAEVVR